MIHRAYIMKSDGEQLLARTYDNHEKASKAEPMPPHVRSCVLLFNSRNSTNLENVYSLEQGDKVWNYVFYENFAVVILATKDEVQYELGKRMLTIGRSIARTFGHVIEFWNGDMSDIEGIEHQVDRFVLMDMDSSDTISKDQLEALVTSILEEHQVSYVGVFDEQGEMLCGNVPEIHISYIRDEISRGLVSTSVGLVPTEIKIRDHRVHVLSVQSLTVAVGTNQTDSKVQAIGATSEIAKSLDDLLSTNSVTAK